MSATLVFLSRRGKFSAALTVATLRGHSSGDQTSNGLLERKAVTGFAGQVQIGSNCGDGMSANQTCYLVPNSGPGNFGTLQEISPNGLPRALQFSARFTF
jgi:hypothetical protein